MNCEAFEAILPDLLRHELPPEVQCEALEHAHQCPACEAEWTSLQHLWQGLQELPSPPDPALVARFQAALTPMSPRAKHPWLMNLALPFAAAVLLLLGGFAAGRSYAFRQIPHEDARLELLHQGRPSDRMLGVALLTQNGAPRDAPSAEMLLDRVEKDPSPQVRLAALEALYLFESQPEVSERLLKSLPHQTNPEVQAAQIELLLALREKRALEALRTMLGNPRLDATVRVRLQKSLAQL